MSLYEHVTTYIQVGKNQTILILQNMCCGRLPSKQAIKQGSKKEGKICTCLFDCKYTMDFITLFHCNAKQKTKSTIIPPCPIFFFLDAARKIKRRCKFWLNR